MTAVITMFKCFQSIPTTFYMLLLPGIWIIFFFKTCSSDTNTITFDSVKRKHKKEIQGSYF